MAAVTEMQDANLPKESQQSTEGAPVAAAGPNPKRKKLLGLFAAGAGTVALAWFGYDWIANRDLVYTDNAYVGADTAQVTPLVSAPVRDLRVVDTQVVRRGDILLLLDDTDQRIALARAEAELAQAQQRFRQATGAVSAAQGTVSARASGIGQARAQVEEAQANVERTRTELSRRRALATSGAISSEELTTATTAYQAAQAALASALAQLRAAEGIRASAAGEYQSAQALVRGSTVETAPDVLAAKSRLDAARLDLARTIIRAPIDGVVANRQVQIGQRVAAGVPVMNLIPIGAAYVDANFKENQLAKVRVGQPVELTSDFYGDDVVFTGKVVGFSGVTGAASALIPAQNATGNWIKVVQRLPVRIAVDSRQLKEHPLRSGLSMQATIDTRSAK